MEKLMRALTTLREFIERQNVRSNNISKPAASSRMRNKGTYEVIDPNTRAGMAFSANLPKEEIRRDDPIMRPEFNPTGW